MLDIDIHYFNSSVDPCDSDPTDRYVGSQCSYWFEGVLLVSGLSCLEEIFTPLIMWMLTNSSTTYIIDKVQPYSSSTYKYRGIPGLHCLNLKKNVISKDDNYNYELSIMCYDLPPTPCQYSTESEYCLIKIVKTLVGVPGILGNIISIVVLTSKDMKNSFNLLLSCLAVIDIIFNILAISDYAFVRGNLYICCK